MPLARRRSARVEARRSSCIPNRLMVNRRLSKRPRSLGELSPVELEARAGGGTPLSLPVAWLFMHERAE